jgi:hypothetical protein
MHAPAVTLLRPVFFGRPLFLAFGGESGGGGASGTWDPDDMPPPFGETYTPEDLPLVEEDTKPPPDARPPTGPSAQGTPQGTPQATPRGTRPEERTTSTSQGWVDMPPADRDDPLGFYAQQFGCLRQGGAFGADGFCTLSMQKNPCKEHQVFDAVENTCVSATEFQRMSEQFAKCRLEGGTVDEKNVTCTESSPKSSSTKIWIGVGVAVATAATLAILFGSSSTPASSEDRP